MGCRTSMARQMPARCLASPTHRQKTTLTRLRTVTFTHSAAQQRLTASPEFLRAESRSGGDLVVAGRVRATRYPRAPGMRRICRRPELFSSDASGREAAAAHAFRKLARVGAAPASPAPARVGRVSGLSPSDGQRGRYALSGQSFAFVVAFRPELRAVSVHVFGQSNDPHSPHYFDQAPLFSEGKMKPVWTTFDQIQANAVRVYHPGAHGAGR